MGTYPKTSRQILVASVVLSAITISMVCAFHWQEIAIRYCLACLESESQESVLGDELLFEMTNSVYGRALDRYVQTTSGKNRLIITYIAIANEDLPRLCDHLWDVSGDSKYAGMLLSNMDDMVCIALVEKGRRTYKVHSDSSRSIAPATLTARIHDLLLKAGLDRFRMPETSLLPGPQIAKTSAPSNIVVSVVGCVQGVEGVRRNFGAVLSCKPRYACLFEPEGSAELESSGGIIRRKD
jgi:hypothetical protein